VNSKLITVKEFAERISVSYSTARRMVADKSVRIVRPHRRAMILESEVARYTEYPVN
jgi:excisionase family DNA binding protein